MKKTRAAALGSLLAAGVIAQTSSAGAFSVDIHEGITSNGLAFLRPAVISDIADQHDQVDSGLSGARDERHYDDCEFDGAAKYIRDRYADSRGALGHLNVWDATDQFGNALHPIQDLYSHANWVEMGFPRLDNPSTKAVEVSQSDLLDLSGAQSSLAQQWYAPDGGKTVRNGILLGGDDWKIPLGWSIRPDGGGRHVPTLVDPAGRTRGRLLVTGEGTFDDECDVHFEGIFVRAYNGLEHDVLNKDNETRKGHSKARALATLQTGYEWCRLVREAGLARRDGLLLTTWVRAGANPHPANTPCAKGGPGPTPIVVTMDSIRVLDSGDDSGPGEVQFAVALYDDPSNFRRSVHAANQGGSMTLEDGDRVSASRLPRPLTLCVGSTGARFAIHGWDNDQDWFDPPAFASDFDDLGDDDDLLVGFQHQFGSVLPSGQQIVRTADLEVRYRVSRSAAAGPVACPGVVAGG